MANIWLIKFLVILGIFAQIFFPDTNFKVLALTNVEGKEQCVGKYQLGVDNVTAIFDSRMLIQFINLGVFPTKSTIENNGHILKIELNYRDNVPTIKADLPPFGVVGTFRVQFLYFQWLKKSISQFSLDNITLPAQLHAVFCNVKAKTCDRAAALDNDIIVLAFHMQVSDWESLNIADLKKNLQYVREPNSKTRIGNLGLDYWAKSILNEYAVYRGSFLEFPCQAEVIWVDYSLALTIKVATVYEFQQLKANEVNPLMGQVSEFVKPKGKAFVNNPAFGGAKKNSLAIPGLIFGFLYMIFSLF